MPDALQMLWKLCLIIEVSSEVTQRTTPLPTVIPFCFVDDCYIRPDKSGKSWDDAQAMCRKYNSTLPIIDNPDRQRSVLAALYNFSLSGAADVWLGAKASQYDPGKWQWLDGSLYTAAAVVQGDGTYVKSYASILMSGLSAFSVRASEPYINYSYICQYNTTSADGCANMTGSTGQLVFSEQNRCFVKYDEKLSWFNARNNCSLYNGDLASFDATVTLSGIDNVTERWVGLRHSQWNWHNAVTRSTSDVKFTLWENGQPNDETPSCVCIDYSFFPLWKDRNCSDLLSYICQVLNETATDEEPPSTTMVPVIESCPPPRTGSKTEVNVPLAIGLGVGIGGAVLITIIIIIIVVVVLRKKHRNSSSIGSTQTKETTVNHNIQMNPKEESTEMNENENQSQLGDYATVQGAKGSEHEPQLTSPSTGQGPVYADLGFDREGP